MDSSIQSVVRACTLGSDEERMSFGEVVRQLMQAGIERYHTDLVRAEKTYHLPNGESEVVPAQAVRARPAEQFSASGVEAAVRAIQTGSIGYNEFCERISAAGCVGYHVSLAGKRAVYYGRACDSHVEWFPGAG